MKRFVLVLVLILSVSGLFAKTKRIYQKKTNISVLELYQDDEIEGARFCLTTYEKATNDEYDYCQIMCDNEQQIKQFMKYLLNHNIGGLYAPTIAAYELIHEELQESNSDIQIDSKKNTITNKYTYFLE